MSTVITCRVNRTKCVEPISRDDRFLYSIVPHWVILRMVFSLLAQEAQTTGHSSSNILAKTC